MSRVRRGFKARQRRNKILKLAKGFHFSRRTKYRHAVQTVVRALHYMYKGRRLLKRNMRKLWIVRINAGVRTNGLNYSGFVNKAKNKGLILNRKMLSEIAARDPQGFNTICEAVK